MGERKWEKRGERNGETEMGEGEKDQDRGRKTWRDRARETGREREKEAGNQGGRGKEGVSESTRPEGRDNREGGNGERKRANYFLPFVSKLPSLSSGRSLCLAVEATLLLPLNHRHSEASRTTAECQQHLSPQSTTVDAIG